MEDTKFNLSEQLYKPSSPSSGSSKKPKLILFIIIAVAIVAGGVLGATRFFGINLPFFSSEKIKEEEEEFDLAVPPTPPPTPTSIPTPTLVATPSPSLKPSPTAKPTITLTPKPTQNPIDKTSGLDRSKLSVEVLNGSGIVGAARKVADLLKNLGYNVVSTGNADNYSYETTTVEVKSEKSDYLSLLKKDLAGSYTIGTTSATLSASVSADARVIIGK